MKSYISGLFLLMMGAVLPVQAGQSLSPSLDMLAPYVGKTWVHESGAPDTARYFRDVSRWQVAMGGHGILIRHSVNDGPYGGVTIIFFDEGDKQVRCTYATTGGFYTECTIDRTEAGILIVETVRGATSGPEQVESLLSLSDGVKTVKSRYKSGADWSDWETRTYRADATAQVIFK